MGECDAKLVMPSGLIVVGQRFGAGAPFALGLVARYRLPGAGRYLASIY